MGSLRVWLFRGLVATAAGLIVASAVMPWWTGEAEFDYFYSFYTVDIYQYGILTAPIWIAEDITPLYQTVLAWIYIAASVGLILWSTWLKGRKGQLILGGIGLIYIAYAAIAAFAVIADRLADLGGSLQGYSGINVGVGEYIFLYATLRFGYYLAYVAGGMCLVLALLRNIIVGRPKISA